MLSDIDILIYKHMYSYIDILWYACIYKYEYFIVNFPNDLLWELEVPQFGFHQEIVINTEAPPRKLLSAWLAVGMKHDNGNP